jgi:hypothetical protein
MRRGNQAARRRSRQIVAASAAAVIATMRSASFNWKFQNRSAGWQVVTIGFLARWLSAPSLRFGRILVARM